MILHLLYSTLPAIRPSLDNLLHFYPMAMSQYLLEDWTRLRHHR